MRESNLQKEIQATSETINLLTNYVEDIKRDLENANSELMKVKVKTLQHRVNELITQYKEESKEFDSIINDQTYV